MCWGSLRRHFPAIRQSAEKRQKRWQRAAAACMHQTLPSQRQATAGPGKGERGEPSGTVFLAVSGAYGTEVYEEHFLGSRKSVRYAAAEKAMYYVMEYIRKRMGK